MKKKVISTGIIMLFTVLTVYIFMTSKEISRLPELMDKIQYEWLSMAGLCMVLYFGFNALLLMRISREVGEPLNILQSLYMSCVGQYYSLITPFASGGQPAQVYVMQKKYGISLAKGTAITVKKFIVYQVVVSVFAISMFLMKFMDIVRSYSNIIIFIVIGLMVNLVGGIGILLIAYNPDLAKKAVAAIVGFLQKFRLFRKFDEKKVFGQIDDYAYHIESMRQNNKTMLMLCIYTVLQLIAFFSITYFVYLSLGQRGAGYMDILAIQTVVYVVVSFIPTPGGAGASEGSFYLLFKAFFANNVLLYGMAIWRLIIYYANILVSGLVIAIDRLSEVIRERRFGVTPNS